MEPSQLLEELTFIMYFDFAFLFIYAKCVQAMYAMNFPCLFYTLVLIIISTLVGGCYLPPSIPIDKDEVMPIAQMMARDQNVIDSLLLDVQRSQHQHVDLALGYAQEAVALAYQHGTQVQRGEAHYWTALLKKRKTSEGNALKDAMVDAKLSRFFFERAGQEEGIIRALNLMGILHFRMENVDSATIYQNQAIYMVHHGSHPIADSLRLLGELYQDLGNTYRGSASIKVQTYYQKSQAYFERSHNLY
ncbi:MAG: hypothetical protein AAFR59_08635, partial [Bacteroidota bacterium]